LDLLDVQEAEAMRIQVPYGHSFLRANIPDTVGVDIIEAPDTPGAAEPLGVVRFALEHLLGGAEWAHFAGARSVAIAINDKTRPVPHHQLLPPLLERLAALGIPDAALTFYVAVGMHLPMSQDEFPTILPDEILRRYRVVSHDSGNVAGLINLGETAGGTPVWSNRAYVKSDFKIVVGNIEPHQFVGFSGGVKTAAIGLAGAETINRNHALMMHPDSRLGEYETNPARRDVEEIGKRVGVHLALNAILNQKREIVHVLAGDPCAVMMSGVPLSRLACQAGVDTRYALMISSPGGHPKDINLYQAQKALGHAALITRTGGTVILAAARPEGTGSARYETWMSGKKTYDEVLDCFRGEGFRIGPHKGYQIARDASRLRLMFCSMMEESLSRTLLLNPVTDLQTALNMALHCLQPGERIGVLPHASSTIPYVKGDT